MKKILTLILSSTLIQATVQAQTVIDLTGSTAGRAAAHNGIVATLTGETFAHDHASDPTRCTRAIYHGTYAGKSYIIRTFWQGSVNGVRDIIAGTQQSGFLAKTVIGTVAGQASTSSPLASASAETAPEIGFSDVFQTSTPFTGLSQEDSVAIIPFKWFRNDGAPATLDNVTNLSARAIYGGLGELPLSLFTGNDADSATTVFATGRSSDSGTRITGLAEFGYGVFNTVAQHRFTVASGVATRTTVNAGNAGESSGGTVANVLAATYSQGPILAWIGATDWPTAVSGGAVELKHNGVAYSENAVRNGSYTFWGYLHQNRMNLTGDSLAFYDALKNAVSANPGSGLIVNDYDAGGAMKVFRTGDGAPVTP